jgi:hypothetical protein
MTTFLRTPRIARRAFGWHGDGQIVSAIPRVRFMFFVEFELSPGAVSMLGNNVNLNSYDGVRGISFKVKTIDKPKVNLTTEELNQYNKKVVVYKKLDYSEASVRLHDAVDNSILALWIDYFTYYFGDSRKKTLANYQQSPIDPQFQDSSGWGLRPLSDVTSFFSRIRIHALYANTTTKFSYINPKIISIDWQSKDATSNEPEEVTISFKYEAIEYEALGDASGFDPTLFGFEKSADIVEVPSRSQATYNSASPKILSPQAPGVQSQNPSPSTQPQAAGQSTPASAPGASTPVPTGQSQVNGQEVDYGP